MYYAIITCKLTKYIFIHNIRLSYMSNSHTSNCCTIRQNSRLYFLYSKKGEQDLNLPRKILLVQSIVLFLSCHIWMVSKMALSLCVWHMHWTNFQQSCAWAIVDSGGNVSSCSSQFWSFLVCSTLRGGRSCLNHPVSIASSAQGLGRSLLHQLQPIQTELYIYHT